MTTTEQPAASAAVEKAGPSSLVLKYKDDFASVLPSHIKAETWVRLAVGALRRDPKLAEAAKNDPASLMVALLEAARQGLEPGTEQYYLTPRKSKGQLHVLGIRGYQGEVELIYRAGAVSSVIVEVVREKDDFYYVPGETERPRHRVDWFGERGLLIGVYAYAVMKDGATSKVVVLNKDDIALAKGYSQGADSEYSPWKRNEPAMWQKTALHRLQKWLPTSAEYRSELIRAHAAVEAVVADKPDLAKASGNGDIVDVVDAEVVSENGNNHADATTGEITDDVWPATAQPPDAEQASLS